MAKIESLFRYPVKGLSAQCLNQMLIREGKGIAFDRRWAIENGTRIFDSLNPRFLPKRTFFQLALNEKLAQLKCHFIEDSQTLIISHNNVEVLRTVMSGAQAVGKVEEFFASFMASDKRGTPRLVSADCHHFTDIPEKAISMVNLASVREISRVTGKEISPLRFRANVYVDGLEPWEEMNWVGKTIKVDGTPAFEIFAVTGRCPATQVNLETGERDVDMLEILSVNFGHTKCGVYMKSKTEMLIKQGGTIQVL